MLGGGGGGGERKEGKEKKKLRDSFSATSLRRRESIPRVYARGVAYFSGI